LTRVGLETRISVFIRFGPLTRTLVTRAQTIVIHKRVVLI